MLGHPEILTAQLARESQRTDQHNRADTDYYYYYHYLTRTVEGEAIHEYSSFYNERLSSHEPIRHNTVKITSCSTYVTPLPV